MNWPGSLGAATSVLVRQGWATQQQGDTDRLNYAAQQQAKQVNDAAIQSQEAQLLVLRQQKAYQQVVAPFDGVVTSGTSMSAAWSRPMRRAAPSCSL